MSLSGADAAHNVLTEAEKVALIRRDWWAIEHVLDPSEAVCLAAVEKNAGTLTAIKNPTETVQIAAVTQRGEAIQYINNPSEAVKLAAVRKSSYAIKSINNPSKAVQHEAIKCHPSQITSMRHFIGNALALHLLYHPLYTKTPKEILDRAPEILDEYCEGLGDVYTIGLSMNMTGDELSRTMMEWTESHATVAAGAEMTP